VNNWHERLRGLWWRCQTKQQIKRKRGFFSCQIFSFRISFQTDKCGEETKGDDYLTVVVGDAVVVDHAAGVQGVAGFLAGAAAVEDSAVFSVPQDRSNFRRWVAYRKPRTNECQLLQFHALPPSIIQLNPLS
jgi:hypothetical protein